MSLDRFPLLPNFVLGGADRHHFLVILDHNPALRMCFQIQVVRCPVRKHGDFATMLHRIDGDGDTNDPSREHDGKGLVKSIITSNGRHLIENLVCLMGRNCVAPAEETWIQLRRADGAGDI
jgi:hypothetical protein